MQSLINDVDFLLTEIESLKNGFEQMQALEDVRQQRIWLGRVAYLFDELACDFVFRSSEVVMLSISGISKRADCWGLTHVQSSHWKDFQRFLGINGWSVYNIVMISKVLRAGNFNDFNDFNEPRLQVTQQHLEKWTCHLQPVQVEGAKSFIGLVAKFALNGRVLHNAGNAVSLIDACLKTKSSKHLDWPKI